ncbi:MAG: helix-turn-helix transcriptional regulator [Nocardioides sp.]
METIGARVAARRAAAGLTQRDVEAKTGISQSTLNRIERDAREAKMDELVAIAWATGATYGEFIGDSEVRDRLQFAGRVGSAEAFEAMKGEAAFFFELDDYLDQFAVARA